MSKWRGYHSQRFHRYSQCHTNYHLPNCNRWYKAKDQLVKLAPQRSLWLVLVLLQVGAGFAAVDAKLTLSTNSKKG